MDSRWCWTSSPVRGRRLSTRTRPSAFIAPGSSVFERLFHTSKVAPGRHKAGSVRGFQGEALRGRHSRGAHSQRLHSWAMRGLEARSLREFAQQTRSRQRLHSLRLSAQDSANAAPTEGRLVARRSSGRDGVALQGRAPLFAGVVSRPKPKPLRANEAPRGGALRMPYFEWACMASLCQWPNSELAFLCVLRRLVLRESSCLPPDCWSAGRELTVNL